MRTQGGAGAAAPPWLLACRCAAESRGVAPDTLRKLAAFAAPPGEHALEEDPVAAWAFARSADFEELESATGHGAAVLSAAITERLSLTLPRPRALDFARRFEALHRGLSGMATLEARLLRVGLSARLSEALARPERRASRARDIIDFYYSHASRLLFGGAGRPSPGALARSAALRLVAPGLSYACVEALSSIGPLRMHLLRARGGRLEARHMGPAAVPLEALVASAGASAGLSGGYVLCSDMDLEAPSQHGDPVGLVVQDGEVLSPPIFPRACLVDGPEGIRVGVVGPVGLRVRCSAAIWTISALNDAGASTGAVANGGAVPAFNRVWGPVSPDRACVSVALLGHRVVGAARGPLPIPKAGLVLSLPPGAAVPPEVWGGTATVRYDLPFEARSAMAGGPMLLTEEGPVLDLDAEHFVKVVPPYTFAADETMDQNLLPRMVAGVTAAGDLWAAAIDGRNFRRGVGITLQDGHDLMAALGCARAMNLDGGDSKRMVVEGRVVDLPGSQLEWDTGAPSAPDASELAGVRPVYSALLLMPR